MTNALTIHIGLATHDVDAARDFYEKLLGQPATKVKPGYAKFMSSNPAVNLSLTQATATHTQDGVSHFGLQVQDVEAFAAMRSRILETGLAPELEEEGVTCCYAVSDKLWVADPDGNRWELFVTHADAEEFGSREPDTSAEGAAVGAAEAASESPCCAPSCCAEPANIQGAS